MSINDHNIRRLDKHYTKNTQQNLYFPEAFKLSWPKETNIEHRAMPDRLSKIDINILVWI